MSKEGTKVNKYVAKRKVNRYTLVECNAELARMANKVSDTNKTGIQSDSKYYRDVEKQKQLLEA